MKKFAKKFAESFAGSGGLSAGKNAPGQVCRDSEQGTDYRKYRCGPVEWLWCFGVSALAAAAVSWLFYRSRYGMVLALPICVLYGRWYQKERGKKRREKLLGEFADGMQAVSASLLAGSSVENAWRAAERELAALHGREAMMTMEFRKMNTEIGMNRPVEELLLEFAGRSGCEDIENFAGIFSFAKRSGGDFVKIIRATIGRISGKIEVEREIATVVAGKKLEGRIMNIMPFVILAYLNLASGEFIDALYGNLTGILVMSGALLTFAVSVVISECITDIRV